MNLLDMLSGGPDMGGDAVMLDPVVTEEVVQHNDGVYRLPAVLTDLQKEMSEIVLQMLKQVLLDDIVSRKQRASINSLLESSGGPDNLPVIDLMFDQLRTIAKHPLLLVDHFIPKRLLLSEINERLVNLLGKFQLFNRIVDVLIETQKPDDGYHLLVVAESVKELELIEGLIIGKNIHYKNFSGRKMYDDRTPLPNFKDEDDVEVPHQHKRRHKRAKLVVPDLFVYLITSLQLYNYPSLASNSRSSGFNLIVSFDADLNSQNPSLELLRTRANGLSSQPLKTPILVPTPAYTLEHLVLEIPPPKGLSHTSLSLRKWKVEVLNAFAVNRRLLYDKNGDFYTNHYGSKMARLLRWFSQWNHVNFPLLEMAEFSDNLSLAPGEVSLTRLLERSYYNVEVELGLTYDEFKRKFPETLHSRMFDNNVSVNKILEKDIPLFRVKELERQVDLDTQEEEIAAQYRQLRQLNETANATDRKLARADQEHARVEAIKGEVSEKLAFLESEKVSSEKLADQSNTIQQLTDELHKLEQEHGKLSEDCEATRASYQASSGEAVQLSSQVKTLKDSQHKLSLKLHGCGMTVLPLLIRKDDLVAYDQRLARLHHENQFIALFLGEKITHLVKERHAILDSTASGLSSRPSNRISRASTPF